MTRTFIALEMNEAIQSHLEKVIHQVARLLPTIRWVDPQSIHLTLAFLGELENEQLVLAHEAARVAATNSHSFSYSLTKIGVFGSVRHPRVIWMGIEESSGSLQRLHRLLNNELEQRGFSTDQRPFSPHLTLARVKVPLNVEETAHLQDILNSNPKRFATATAYPVEHIHVMKSELLRTGPIYTPLSIAPLA